MPENGRPLNDAYLDDKRVNGTDAEKLFVAEIDFNRAAFEEAKKEPKIVIFAGGQMPKILTQESVRGFIIDQTANAKTAMIVFDPDTAPDVPPVSSDVYLRVAYMSQWDPSVGGIRNACGPTCVWMLLRTLSMWPGTVADLYNDPAISADKNNYLSVQALVALMRNKGLRASAPGSLPVDAVAAFKLLNDELALGHPVIVLVNYKYITPDEFAHFFVVVGKDEYGYFVHDPYAGTIDSFAAYPEALGSYRYITLADFENAWGKCDEQGNPNWMTITLDGVQFMGETALIADVLTVNNPYPYGGLVVRNVAGTEVGKVMNGEKITAGHMFNLNSDYPYRVSLLNWKPDVEGNDFDIYHVAYRIGGKLTLT